MFQVGYFFVINVGVFAFAGIITFIVVVVSISLVVFFFVVFVVWKEEG